MASCIDFSARTFLERVALAAREPVYSAALAWVFGDGSPMTLSERINVLEKLCRIKLPDVQGITAQTEWNKIDLLLTLRTDREPKFIAVDLPLSFSSMGS